MLKSLKKNKIKCIKHYKIIRQVFLHNIWLLEKTPCLVSLSVYVYKYTGVHACLVTQLSPTLCDLIDCNPSGSSVHGDSPSKNPGVGCRAFLQGNLPNPGIKPRALTLQADSLSSEPPGKPMNIGVGSLSLLQGTFLTQEFNKSFLHCRQILQ